MKAIVNGKIILKDRVVEDGVLLYSDVIEGVVKNDQIPEGAEIIDAKGGYVAPGLIELHIHGYLGKDVCDGEEESLRVIAEGIVQNGVTAFLPTTMTESMETITKALESIRGCMEKSKTWKGSVILGAHAEGMGGILPSVCRFTADDDACVQDNRFSRIQENLLQHRFALYTNSDISICYSVKYKHLAFFGGIGVVFNKLS